MNELSLGFGLTFADLHDDRALNRVDAAFLGDLGERDPGLRERLVAARGDPDGLGRDGESEVLLALAPHLDGFLARLFGIEAEVEALAAGHRDLKPLYACKRLFVQRRAAKTYPPEAAAGFDGTALRAALAERWGGPFDQRGFAIRVMEWLAAEKDHGEDLDLAARYAAWALHTEAGRRHHRDDVLFRAPERVDPGRLVATETVVEHGIEMMRLAPARLHPRDGFSLTDPGTDLVGALDQANYCIWCHHQGRDSCSKGMKDKRNGQFVVNPLGIPLTGCPLDEKISEMHEAKTEGLALAALALVVVDNPMAVATGHRICNDCMKACIYQKQEPVNIPDAETRVVKDVLALPWGFEIYALLSRWNPLNLRRPLLQAESGYKVLIVGLGPAGFGLAHELLNAGHAVVGIDGAKIEPLAADLSGVEQDGRRVPFRPIRDVGELYEDLDRRVMAGFGGVAEYGITVRWNKNFLKLARLLIERRRRFTMIGGVRLGGAITPETAFAMGFDHVALCLGAGRPTLLGVPNELARGVRQASDFLMALQLTGAAKFDSMANLQIRMPIVVIGGGLTAIDAATEGLAYYVRQVEKFRRRYDLLVERQGEAAVRAAWSAEEAEIADEYLEHAGRIADERARAAAAGERPNFIALLDGWGGATVVYRRRMVDAPSYCLNHEEILKAMEQGVRFAELLAPVAVETDRFDHVAAIRLARQTIGDDGRPQPTGAETVLPVRSLLVAAGTQPNTVLAREHKGVAALDGKYFQALDDAGNPVSPERSAKPAATHVLTRLRDDGRCISFFGDLHPSFAGNVVKALASARRGFPVVDRMLRKRRPTGESYETLAARLNDGLRPVIESVTRLTPEIVEVVLHAPLAAAAHGPGQFFRLQNFEANAMPAEGTTLAMEAVALTGAHVDPAAGRVSLISLNMGGSTAWIPWLQAGEPVVLMGPNGAPTETHGGETVLLLGGGVGNAVLLTMNAAFRRTGARILYFAAYKRTIDRFYPGDIEANSDQIIWCCDEAPGFEPGRAQDRSFVGNIVEALQIYAEGRLGDGIRLDAVDRIVVVGGDRMMAAVAEARRTTLKAHFRSDAVGIASINSPMQCMMKEICAQCLQPHRDPETGKRSAVFSCFNQDQNLDRVDFAALHQRLCQNAVQEKLTRQWMRRCLETVASNRRPI
jgi:NADPH-dependent glutamate synthase beta subunit-like oxidoreductase/NAD(P)H-flavin reductase